VVGNTVNGSVSARIQTNQILTFPFKWLCEVERRKENEKATRQVKEVSK